MSLAFALRAGIWLAVIAHFIPAVTDKGLSSATAAGLIGAFGLMSIPGRLIGGALGDRLEPRVVHGGMTALMGLGLLAFIWGSGLWMLLAFLVLYALGGGGAAATFWSVVSTFFGRTSYGAIVGWTTAALVAGTATLPILAGFLYDATGSYTLAFGLFAGCAAVSVAAMAVARPPSRRARAL